MRQQHARRKIPPARHRRSISRSARHVGPPPAGLSRSAPASNRDACARHSPPSGSNSRRCRGTRLRSIVARPTQRRSDSSADPPLTRRATLARAQSAQHSVNRLERLRSCYQGCRRCRLCLPRTARSMATLDRSLDQRRTLRWRRTISSACTPHGGAHLISSTATALRFVQQDLAPIVAVHARFVGWSAPHRGGSEGDQGRIGSVTGLAADDSTEPIPPPEIELDELVIAYGFDTDRAAEQFIDFVVANQGASLDAQRQCRSQCRCRPRRRHRRPLVSRSSQPRHVPPPCQRQKDRERRCPRSGPRAAHGKLVNVVIIDQGLDIKFQSSIRQNWGGGLGPNIGRRRARRTG